MRFISVRRVALGLMLGCPAGGGGDAATAPAASDTGDPASPQPARTRRKGASCGVLGEQRYLVDEQPHLASTFACLALVGTRGSVEERPIEALLAATGAGDGEAALCNAGFPRDDALLIVTLITDEDDEASGATPMTGSGGLWVCGRVAKVPW